MSLQQRRLKDGSFARQGDGDSALVRTATDAILRGIEIRGFVPISTIAEKAQVGLTLGVGVAHWQGAFAEAAGAGEPIVVSGKGLFPFLLDRDVIPTVRLELTGAWIVTPNVKAIATGGLNLPGLTKFSIGLVYLFGGS